MAQDKKVLLPLWLTVVDGDHRCHKPHAAFSHFFPLQIRFCVYLYIHTLKKTQTKPYGLPSTFCYIHRRRQTKNCCGTKISEKEKTSFSLASALPSCSCTKHLKHEKVLSCDTDHLLISYLHILKRTAVSSCVGAIHPSGPWAGVHHSLMLSQAIKPRGHLCATQMQHCCVCERVTRRLIGKCRKHRQAININKDFFP